MVIKLLTIANSICIIAVISFGVYFYFSKPRQAYVLNQEVFNQYLGKKDLEKRLTDLKTNQQSVLDSIASLLGATKDPTALRGKYTEMVEKFQIQQQDLSQRYTADIWKNINSGVAEYAAKENYDFVFGASGNGNLMYAKEGNNITSQVVAYLNSKYK
jgi:Skp family chaperone for outer membrane proteins